ncbi:hypothetical protein [Mycobacterium avium]|uniref:Lipoprotein n=1 Tax=Mycobacterium avium (strain 104) TaxID=243243 RepID=A0A0H2ZTL2_MYCA1|nr:hypothetical protein [Mycobacterium avium]ABK65149.1 hypothetical protein MAV_0260 [Mycobacterium avium 104]KDP09290.1 hypothetical protein MAV101_01310 [Mycobacterium avium subsp. hominissuis 101]MBZ4509052.1 hypothetical protein [Mycobacterium avium subsp. hominissuis]MCG3243028.1 hypothetical protein [Mycobacterium avium subsp. hominissuis]
MNKQKYSFPVAALAAVMTLAACGTPTEPASAPSSVSASPFGAREVKRAEAQVGERELALHGVLSIPSTVDRIAAEAAASKALPYAFTYRTGCTWLRTWDAKLWSLHSGGGVLARGVDDERWFRSNPGAASDSICRETGSVPTADDASVSTPYRWRDGNRDLVRVQGVVFELPRDIPEPGVALRPAKQN